MQHLILKKELSPLKLEALINFLKSWNVDVEIQNDIIQSKTINNNNKFYLSSGIWDNYEIDSASLRKKAWKQMN